MEHRYVKIPEVIEELEEMPEGGNCPTLVKVHKCLCGKGVIRHSRVPGFDDEYYEIECSRCEKKYHPIIDRVGNEWKMYLI